MPALATASTPLTSAPPPTIISRTVDANDGGVRFDDFVTLGKLSPALRKNLPFDVCSDIQAATLEKAVLGSDILARAKTGTGKTIAFLLPSIERLMRAGRTHPAGKVAILVISPTRELANQIAKEAERLIEGTGLRVLTVTGGTNIKREQARLAAGVEILVATPGRFKDHIQNSELKDRLSDVRTFVLDEADVLLDMGFRNEMIYIMEQLPNRAAKPRQTLLFSATVSAEIKKIVTLALLPNYESISTVTAQDQATHEHVDQSFVVTSLRDTYPATFRVLRDCLDQGKNKLMVFSTTARAAGVAYEMFSNVQPPLGVPILQIHSRMSQSARTKSTDQFRKAEAAILFSSDVTARGMDFPEVDAVIQLGMPSDSDTYIHRLGRTARAGMGGSGILILYDFEKSFLDRKAIKELTIKPHPSTAAILSPATLEPLRASLVKALARVDDKEKAQAYQAFLGYYNTHAKSLKINPTQLVEMANEYATSCIRYGELVEGAPLDVSKLPPIFKKTIGKMQLKGTFGLNAVANPPVTPRGRPSQNE